MATKSSPDPYAQYADPYAKYADTGEKSKLQEIAGSGPAKFLGPLVGGGLGGANGAAMGASLGLLGGPAAPITVPAGAILGGMIGAGVGTAGTEAARQQLAGEEQNLPEALKQGAIAGATEPVGLLLGPGIKAARGMNDVIGGAGGVANAGKRFLGGVSKELEERFPGASQWIESVAPGRQGVKQLEKASESHAQVLKHEINVAENTGQTVQPINLLNHVLDVIDKLDRAGSPMAERVRQRANKFLDVMDMRKWSNGVGAKQVQEIKQGADAALEKLFESKQTRRTAGKLIKRPGAKTVEENFNEALRRGAKEWLESVNPNLGPVNEDLRALRGAQIALKGRASQLARRSLSRVTTAASTAALPGDIGHHVGAGLIGYHLGQYAEPLITPIAGAGLGLLQSPLVQQGIRQVPRAIGLGANAGASDQ